MVTSYFALRSSPSFFVASWALLGTSWGAKDDQDDAQMGPGAPKVAQKAAKVAQKAPKMRSGRPRKDPQIDPSGCQNAPQKAENHYKDGFL